MRIIFVFGICVLSSCCDCVRIGGLFHSNQDCTNETSIVNKIDRCENKNFLFGYKPALEFAILMRNKQNDGTKINKPFTSNIITIAQEENDAFQISKQVCSQLALGIAAMVTSLSSDFVQSAFNAKQMPLILIKDSLNQFPNADLKYSLNMSPSNQVWGQAIADISLFYRWKKIGVVYCQPSGIVKIQPFLQKMSAVHGVEVSVWGILSRFEMRNTLKMLRERKVERIIVECSGYNYLLELLKTMLELGLMDSRFQLILYGEDSHLLVEENKYIFGGRNITTLSLFNPNKTNEIDYLSVEWKRYLVGMQLNKDQTTKNQFEQRTSGDLSSLKFSTSVALMYDAIQLHSSSLANLYASTWFSFNHRSLPCSSDKTWHSGPALIRSMKGVAAYGLTGPIRFDKYGQRTGVQFNLQTITYSGLNTIGSWSNDRSNRLVVYNDKDEKARNSNSSMRNTTYIITTLIDEPYVFKEFAGKSELGVDNYIYTGFCIDLLNILADDLDFAYKLVEVHDGLYGAEKEGGRWDGMVGELIEGHADIAVAPLTITYDRERVVRFTTPYMSLGVGILFRKPQPGNPQMFGFLNPLSVLIWVLVIVSYLAVGLVMFCISRISPSEWQNPHPCQPNFPYVENNFGILNSLWFGVGALMQQGSDVSPRSLSTRLLAGVWWFFTLILISSYTANLAAFLTVTRLDSAITSAEDLATQTRIDYGTLRDGSTAAFFENSRLKTYAQMWTHINHTQAYVDSNQEGVIKVLNENYAYLMESPTMQYVISKNCNLTQVGGLLDTRGYGLATTDTALRDRLSMTILKLQENGVIDQLQHKWWNENATVCPTKEKSATQSLTVANLSGAFVFLSIGALVAIIVAVAEFTAHSLKNSRENKASLCQEIGIGLATVCSCKDELPKSMIFETSKRLMNYNETDTKDVIRSQCCSIVQICNDSSDAKKLKENEGKVVSNSSKANCKNSRERYCQSFNTMMETVLNDPVQSPNPSSISDKKSSTLSLSKENQPMSNNTSIQRLSQLPRFGDTVDSSDIQSSSYSITGSGQESKCGISPLEYDSSAQCIDSVHGSTGRGLCRDKCLLKRMSFANQHSCRAASLDCNTIIQTQPNLRGELKQHYKLQNNHTSIAQAYCHRHNISS